MQFPPLVISASIDSGTGNLELTGFSQRSRQSLPAAVVDGDVFYYGITSQAADQWEEGIGRFVSGSPNELERLRCIRSNNNDAFCDFQGGQKLISIVSPSILQAAAHLHKTPVRAVATANVSLSSDISDGDTLDGITLATGDRVLLVNQSTGSQNGIWEVTADTAVRPPDFFTADSARGTMVSVLEGTAGAGKSYICTTAAGSDVIGTDALTWKLAIADISNAILKDGSVAFTGDQSLGNHKLTNVTDPSAAQDAATKAYVDAFVRGLDWKASCRAATTGNITLSGEQTIDGVSVVAGNRVLVKDQSTGSENGIYVAAAGSWSRATDADADAEVTAGLVTTVTEGTANGDKSFVLTTNDPITVGTTALAFSLVGGSSGPTDAADVTYTPADATDWNSDTDPGDVNDALDQLAERLTTVETSSGGVATDTLWNAKGDLAVGTADNTATRLAVGTNGQVLTADSTQTSGVKWATPSGGGGVSGPVSSTDRALALFNGTDGAAITDAPDWAMSADGRLTGKSTVFPTVVATDGATVTFDLEASNFHHVTLEGDRTLALSNVAVGQNFQVALQQDATGGRGVTWWDNIAWPGGIAPTISTAANARDLFGFRVAGLDGESNPWFYGFVHGQNFFSPDDAPPDYLFFDSFSSGSGSIDGRSLEYGAATWDLVDAAGDVKIFSGQAVADTATGVAAVIDTGIEDMEVEVYIEQVNDFYMDVVVGGTSITNCYLVGLDLSTGVLKINKRTGSFSYELLDSVSTSETSGTITISKIAGSINISIGSTTLSVVDGSPINGTLAGVRMGIGDKFDNFTVRAL